MANKNNSNQPTNAAGVRNQNQQSAQKATQGSYNTEFGAEFAPKTNATQPQGGTNNRTEFGAEFASQTNPTEVKKQNQQSAQKASNRNNNSTK
ncbi:gamma-type small acid-soluble spore protein [Paenisporosarcina sp. OV554]|uniref:gamma-type small acid-soluble spore protein n=1 Tax=Paenisporosarcina sp. OV554 TaxID=2135694 RepID=UPI000D39FC5D|nr:gamma-type small acid-soluble spore protein [Paenisporosarcina sp. OV554]PUB08488.1 small acid-soluble spore protein gamma-type [Paenisporosarcina sp. OV554]